MNIVALLLLLVLSPAVDARDKKKTSKFLSSLSAVMKCKGHRAPRDPVIALSPKRFMQTLAALRKDMREFHCSQPVDLQSFDIDDMDSWNFCVAGDCHDGSCFCYETFSGEYCQYFSGKCKMFYCRLHGCSPPTQDMACTCENAFHYTSSGFYWEDEGLVKQLPGQEKSKVYFKAELKEDVERPESNESPDETDIEKNRNGDSDGEEESDSSSEDQDEGDGVNLSYPSALLTIIGMATAFAASMVLFA